MSEELEELKDIAYDFSEAYKQSNVPESQLYGAGANKKEEYQDWSEKDDKLFKALNKLGQYEDIDENPELLAKKIKALEIIKREPIETITEVLSFDTFEKLQNYCRRMGTVSFVKTQEEYDLLKEVFE